MVSMARLFICAMAVFALFGCAPIQWSPAGSASAESQGKPSAIVLPVMGWNFDWDDNICYMPTKIILFSRHDGSELPVTTGEFAKIRSDIGKKGKWRDYELRGDAETGSLRYFFHVSGRNYFLEDLKTVVEGSKPEQWQGPSWKYFVEAMQSPETVVWTTIITARGHTAEDMMEGLHYLRDKGYLKNVPPAENLYAMGRGENPSLAKTVVMRKILNSIQEVPISPTMPEVVDREGHGKKKLHLWGFSDDDQGNFDTAVKVLSAEVKAGKYPDVKITIFFTGGADRRAHARRVILTPDGGTRPPSGDDEKREAQRLLRLKAER